MTRPEISFKVCQISTRVKNATAADILYVNKVIKFVKSTPSSISIPKLDLKSLSITVFADASFNNLPDSRVFQIALRGVGGTKNFAGVDFFFTGGGFAQGIFFDLLRLL